MDMTHALFIGEAWTQIAAFKTEVDQSSPNFVQMSTNCSKR